MNPVKQKIIDDLAKIADRKDTLKRQLISLDEREKKKQQKLLELNNTEILGLVESYNMTPEELADFLLQAKGAPAIAESDISEGKEETEDDIDEEA